MSSGGPEDGMDVSPSVSGAAEVESLVNGGGVSVAGEGAGPSAPPAAGPRSYAAAAAGAPRGSRGVSLPLDSGDSDFHRRFLEALKKGERTVNVEGREVDLSFWIERHGLAAFQERRGGETIWSLPTTGPGVTRRNVVRLRWRSDDPCPPRARVVELLLKMDFRATDVFALIQPFGTSAFDVSFVRPEGLELFWSNYELAKEEPGWRGFAVQAVSRQNGIKKVTVLTSNESLSAVDILTWLSRYGEVTEVPRKNRDEFGIWSGGWTFMVKLKCSGGTVTHIPSSAFLGRDRILIFYQGQPKVCHRCGDPRHFSANCKVQKCALCGGVGHLAASCGDIRCHLCGDLGHPYSRCPRSFSNAISRPVGEDCEGVPSGVSSAVAGGGGGEGAEGSVRKDRARNAAYQRRQERRQRDGGQEEPRETGVMTVPSPGAAASVAAASVSEAPGEEAVCEEIRRMEKEEQADPTDSSQYESLDEEVVEKPKEKGDAGARKKKGKKKGAKKSPLPPATKVLTEGLTGSPLISLSNRFQALDNSAVTEVGGKGPGATPGELSGGGGVHPPEGTSSSGGGTAPESRGEENKDMDTTVSLKRRGDSGSSSEERGTQKKKAGGGKKKAV